MDRLKKIDKVGLIRNGMFFLFALFIFSCRTKTSSPEPEVKKEPPIVNIDTPHKVNKNYLKERDLLSYIRTAEMVKPKKAMGRPFDSLDYDKVIAYDFDGNEEPFPSIIDKKGSFVPVVIRQQFLTQKQADKIFYRLTRISTYGETTAFCFEPHFALLLFKGSKIVYKINICLDCNYLIADTEIPAENHFKVKIGDDYEYFLHGFSKSGRRGIIDLCKELNFDYATVSIDRNKSSPTQ